MTRQTTEPLPDYRLSASNRTVRELVGTMWFSLDLRPPYQRGSVWTLDQRIALVKSWIMGIQIPAIILNDRGTREWKDSEGVDVYDNDAAIWAVVDGKQRLETGRRWFQDELTVPASWFRPEFVEQSTETRDGPYVAYMDLTEVGRRRIANNFFLGVIESKLPSIQAEAELYVLVNGGGTAPTPENMANAARIAAERK